LTSTGLDRWLAEGLGAARAAWGADYDRRMSALPSTTSSGRESIWTGSAGGGGSGGRNGALRSSWAGCSPAAISAAAITRSSSSRCCVAGRPSADPCRSSGYRSSTPRPRGREPRRGDERGRDDEHRVPAGADRHRARCRGPLRRVSPRACRRLLGTGGGARRYALPDHAGAPRIAGAVSRPRDRSDPLGIRFPLGEEDPVRRLFEVSFWIDLVRGRLGRSLERAASFWSPGRNGVRAPCTSSSSPPHEPAVRRARRA